MKNMFELEIQNVRSIVFKNVISLNLIRTGPQNGLKDAPALLTSLQTKLAKHTKTVLGTVIATGTNAMTLVGTPHPQISQPQIQPPQPTLLPFHQHQILPRLAAKLMISLLWKNLST